MTEPTDKKEVSPEHHPLRAILERHGITDPSQHLVDHKNLPVDYTPQVEGAPLLSREEVTRRMRILRFL